MRTIRTNVGAVIPPMLGLGMTDLAKPQWRGHTRGIVDITTNGTGDKSGLIELDIAIISNRGTAIGHDDGLKGLTVDKTEGFGVETSGGNLALYRNTIGSGTNDLVGLEVSIRDRGIRDKNQTTGTIFCPFHGTLTTLANPGGGIIIPS